MKLEVNVTVKLDSVQLKALMSLIDESIEKHMKKIEK